MDMSSPAAGNGTVDATLTMMEETLNDGGKVALENAGGEITHELNNVEKFNEWKSKFFSGDNQE